MYRHVMNCMKKYEDKGSEAQSELCGFSRMIWTNCMDSNWKIYYPIAANAHDRQSANKKF